MVFLVIYILCVLVALGVGVMAGWADFSRMKIPNVYSLAIVGAFLVAYVSGLFSPGGGIFFGWQSHLIAGLFMFVATFALYHFRVFGAGDSKLLTAFAFWVGLKGLPGLLFYVTIFGAVLALLTWCFRRWKPFQNMSEESWIAKAQAGKNVVPYGIAVTLGAFCTFIFLGYFGAGVLSTFVP